MTARAPNVPRSMFRSQLENDYYNHLYALQAAGEVLWFGYECWKFKIGETTRGDGIWYKPDFVVVNREGEIELHETKKPKDEKGRWVKGQKQAVSRLNSAAGTYPPLRWILVEGSRGGWKKTEVKK